MLYIASSFCVLVWLLCPQHKHISEALKVSLCLTGWVKSAHIYK